MQDGAIARPKVATFAQRGACSAAVARRQLSHKCGGVHGGRDGHRQALSLFGSRSVPGRALRGEQRAGEAFDGQTLDAVEKLEL